LVFRLKGTPRTLFKPNKYLFGRDMDLHRRRNSIGKRSHNDKGYPMASTPSKDYRRREREQKKADKRRAREEAKAEKLAAEKAAAELAAEEAAKQAAADLEAKIEAEFEAELQAEIDAEKKGAN
jgi:hypothetical protein